MSAARTPVFGDRVNGVHCTASCPTCHGIGDPA